MCEVTDEERDRCLAAIRRGRLARGGRPAPVTRESVLRDTIANCALSGMNVQFLRDELAELLAAKPEDPCP